VLMSRQHHAFATDEVPAEDFAKTAAFDHLIECIVDCQRQGVFSAAVPAQRIGLTLWSAAHGAAALAVSKPALVEEIGIEQLADDIICAVGIGVAVMHRIPDASPDSSQLPAPDDIVGLLDSCFGTPSA